MDKNKALQSKRDYDILNMLNSISNFEIFTPFEVAQNMVNLLPEEVFKDPSYKFLDPCVKSGIFLREIIYKLNDNLPRIKHTDVDSGITYDLSDKKERISHILRNMIYGIAISELTAYVSRRTIYGVMDANKDKQSEYIDSKKLSLEAINKKRKEEEKLNIKEELDKKIDDTDKINFNDYYDYKIFNTKDRNGYEKEGNIFYPSEETNIENEDTHHPFINETEHKFINLIKEEKVKFNVIIGNPPYQQNDGGGNGSSAIPIYNKFIMNAKNLNPNYLSFIIPSRWFSGGKGLDDFRKHMLEDLCLEYLIDYSNSKLCFPNLEIEGGVCYFLWNKNKNSKYIKFKDFENNNKFVDRVLNEYDVFIRKSEAIEILNKIKSKNIENIYNIVSVRKPFGITGDFKKCTNNKKDIIVHTKKENVYIKKNEIPKIHNSFENYKVIVSKINGAAMKNGKIISVPFIIKPKEICTETFIILGDFKTIKEASNYLSYTKTKFYRFLLLLRKPTIILSRGNTNFIPLMDMNKEWDDEKLYAHFNLSKEEIEYIEKTIKPME